MITIYTTPNCGYCHMAKEYFKLKSVEYTEKDITSDAKAYYFVVETVGQAATPVIDIEGDIILGYDLEKINNTLKAKKLI